MTRNPTKKVEIFVFIKKLFTGWFLFSSQPIEQYGHENNLRSGSNNEFRTVTSPFQNTFLVFFKEIKKSKIDDAN